MLYKRKVESVTTMTATTTATTAATTESLTPSSENGEETTSICSEVDQAKTPEEAAALPPQHPISSCGKSKKKQNMEKKVYEVEEENCDIISDAFWESSCRLTDFGCSERPYPNRNIAIDRLEDFSKW